MKEDDTSNYESQVRDKPRDGKSVASGFATGPNRKGVTQAEVKDAVQAALKDKSDPLEDRPLPRNERDHTVPTSINYEKAIHRRMMRSWILD